MNMRLVPFPRRKQFSTFYFFQLGFWTQTPISLVVWVGLDDILAGTLWSTTVILLAYSITDILAKVVSPAVINRISFHLSFALLTILLVVSILLLVITDYIKVRIIGVAVIGLANGFTLITCVRMLAYYTKADLLANAYRNGIQCSIFLASLGYTGMTTWFCVAPRIVISACIPICFIPLGTYILLDKEPLKDHLNRTANVVKYTKLPEDENCDVKENEIAPRNKFLIFMISFPLFIYTYWSTFCLQFSITAVLTSLTFPSSPFQPRDHFQYYRIASDAGILTGGMGSLMIGCMGQKWINNFFGIRNTGVLVVLNVFHMLFFVCASWYRFLPDVILLFVLCFTQGIAFGLAHVQSTICSSNLFSNPRDKGTAIGITEVGTSAGRICAAFLGIFAEQYLREHCEYNFMLGQYCLARIPSSAGWSTNLICKK